MQAWGYWFEYEKYTCRHAVIIFGNQLALGGQSLSKIQDTEIKNMINTKGTKKLYKQVAQTLCHLPQMHGHHSLSSHR